MSRFGFSRPSSSAGGQISFTRPSGSSSLGFTLSSTGVMSAPSSKKAPAVQIITGSSRPRIGDILFLSSAGLSTQKENDIAYFSTANNWSGDEDQEYVGVVVTVDETGDDCHWVVTYEKADTMHAHNVWKGLYQTELVPETTLGISEAQGVLIPWIGQPPSTAGDPMSGYVVPEIKCVFTLHKRSKKDDSKVQIIPYNMNF